MTADEVFVRVPLHEITCAFESWSATRHGRTRACVAVVVRGGSRYRFVCSSRAEAEALISEISGLVKLHYRMKGAS